MSLYGGDREEQLLSEAGLSRLYSGVHYVSLQFLNFKNGKNRQAYSIGICLT